MSGGVDALCRRRNSRRHNSGSQSVLGLLRVGRLHPDRMRVKARHGESNHRRRTHMKAITVEPHKPETARLEDIPEADARGGSVLVEAIAVAFKTGPSQTSWSAASTPTSGTGTRREKYWLVREAGAWLGRLRISAARAAGKFMRRPSGASRRTCRKVVIGSGVRTADGSGLCRPLASQRSGAPSASFRGDGNEGRGLVRSDGADVRRRGGGRRLRNQGRAGTRQHRRDCERPATGPVRHGAADQLRHLQGRLGRTHRAGHPRPGARR